DGSRRAEQSCRGRGVRVAAQDESISRIWGDALAELEASPDITPRQLAFVRMAVPLGLLDETFLIAVGTDATKEFLEMRVRDELTAALSTALGRGARFAVTLTPDLADNPPAPLPPRPEPVPEPAPAPPAPR